MGKWLVKISNFSESIANKFKKSVMKKNDREDKRIFDPTFTKNLIKYYIPGTLTVLLIYQVLTSVVDEKAFNTQIVETENRLPIGKGVGAETESLLLKKQKEEFARDLLVKTTPNSNAMMTIPGANNIATGKALPNKFECNELLSKVSRGDTLSSEEKGTANTCIEKNTMGLTSEQQKAARMAINDDTLPPDARKKLAEFAQDTTGVDGALANEARLLMSADPIIAEAARKSYDPNVSPEDRKKYREIAEGTRSKGEINKLNEINNPKIAKGLSESSELVDNPTSSGKENSGNGFSGVASNGTESTTELAKSISDDETEKKRLEDEKKTAVEAINEGKDPTPHAQKIAENSSKIKVIEERVQVKKIRFQEVVNNLNRELATVKRIAKGGSAEGYQEIKEEEIIPEFTPRKTKRLTEDELRLLALFESTNKNPRRLSDLTGYEGIEIKATVAGNSFHNIEAKKGITLPPGLKLAAVLDEDIWCSEKNFANIRVRVRLLQDASEMESGKKVLFAQSILVGKITNIDPSTKSVSVSFDKAQVGGTVVDVKITTQIMGDVIETRGLQITAVILTDMASAIADKIRKDAEDQLSNISTPALADTFNTAGTSAIGSGIQKVGQLLANDLQNAAKVFFSPKGVKIVLYP